jgi:hypothetical protein
MGHCRIKQCGDHSAMDNAVVPLKSMVRSDPGAHCRLCLLRKAQFERPWIVVSAEEAVGVTVVISDQERVLFLRLTPPSGPGRTMFVWHGASNQDSVSVPV